MTMWICIYTRSCLYSKPPASSTFHHTDHGYNTEWCRYNNHTNWSHVNRGAWRRQKCDKPRL